MALPLLTRHLVETTLRAYCTRKVPAHVRDQVRLNFVIEDDRVTLNEERDAFGRPGTWITTRIAHARGGPSARPSFDDATRRPPCKPQGPP